MKDKLSYNSHQNIMFRQLQKGLLWYLQKSHSKQLI